MNRGSGAPRHLAARTRRALLAVIDAVHQVPAGDPHARYQVRFTVGGSLLAILVAIPSLAIEVATGDQVGMALIGTFAGAIILQLGAIRLGVSTGLIMWTLLGSVAVFLVATMLATRELDPPQLAWLVLLPLAAQALVGPRATDAEPAPSSHAPLLAAIVAVALGLAVVGAHQVGLTIHRPVAVQPKWMQAVDFALFMASAYGLDFLHELSSRESLAELAQLRRLLSMCAWCKKIRDQDRWVPLERYLAEHQRHDLTHGICPTCLEMQHPEAE